jgi:hypothetical protein
LAWCGRLAPTTGGTPTSTQRAPTFEAAVALCDQGQFATAVSLLDRALEVLPAHPKLLGELSTALEAQMRYPEAARRLLGSDAVGTDPWVTYLAAFHALMAGDRATSRATLDRVDAGDDGSLAFAVQQLRRAHARADALDAVTSLDDRDLDGWHAVINGTVLLHESVHGYDEPMRGRFAWVADTPGRMRAGIDRIVGIRDALDLDLPAVFAAADRCSRVLAAATAAVLDVPCIPLAAAGDGPGLVVVYDLARVDDAMMASLAERRPGQLLWVHATCWVDPPPFAPDVTTFLHQFCQDPWSGGVPVHDPDTGETRRSEPDVRDDAALVQDVLDAAPDPGQSPRADVMSIARILWRCETFREAGRRRRQRAGSMVPSNRFL